VKRYASETLMTEFTSLPDEVLLFIFSDLSLRDIPSIALVCKRFEFLANDALLWKGLFFVTCTLPKDHALHKKAHSVLYEGKSYKLLMKEFYSDSLLWKKRENTTSTVVSNVQYVTSVRLQFDTSKIVYGGTGMGNTVRVWTGPKQDEMFPVGHDVYNIHFNDNLLVTSSAVPTQQNLGIRLWKVDDWTAVDTKRPKLVQQFDGEAGGVNYQAFDGRLLVSGNQAGPIHVREIETGKVISTITSDTQVTAFHTSFAEEGSVIVGRADGTVLLYDMRTADCVRSFRGANEKIVAIQHDPTTGTIIGATRYGLKRWETKSDECTHKVNIQMMLGNGSGLESLLWISPSVNCLQFDRHKLITGMSSGPLAMWNTKDLSLIRSLESDEERYRTNRQCSFLQFNAKVLLAVVEDEWRSTIKAWKVHK